MQLKMQKREIDMENGDKRGEETYESSSDVDKEAKKRRERQEKERGEEEQGETRKGDKRKPYKTYKHTFYILLPKRFALPSPPRPYHCGNVVPCLASRWPLRWLFLLKACVHSGHWKGRSPAWMLRCCLRLKVRCDFLPRNSRPHTPQTELPSPPSASSRHGTAKTAPSPR